MRSVYAAWSLLSLVAVLFIARPAFADGKRDLEDGVAFYENLDTDRALQRLSSASKATDLSAKDRARAFLYLGMVHFENGSRPDAEKAWRNAFELDRNVEVPKGTSPKTIEAIETARSSIAKPPVNDEPGNKPRDNTPPIKKDPTPLPKVTTEPPKQETKPDLSATTAPEPTKEEEGGSSTWIWVTVIGVAVLGGAAAAIYVATSGSDCEGGGGCLSVSFH